MEFLIPDAIVLGVVFGLLFRRLIGYLTIPLVGLGAGVWWAARQAGDIKGGTSDIFENQAPELLVETALTFALAAAQAALASWATMAVISYVVTRRSNRKADHTLSTGDRQGPQRPT